MDKEEYYNIIFNKFQEQGYVTNNFVEDTLLSFDIQLTEIENVYNNIIENGILVISSQVDIERYSTDYGFYDYEKMYQEIINIEPNLKYYISEVKNIRPPQWHEFDNLLIQAKKGNAKARGRIIEMYLRVAVKQAYYYYNRYDIPLEEAIQEANNGLVAGYEKYGNGQTLKFQNHIQWYIRTSLDRKLTFSNNYIHFPIHIKERLIKISPIIKDKTEAYIHRNKNKLIRRVCYILECDKKKANRYINCFLGMRSIELLDLKDENIFSDKNDYITMLDERITNYLLNQQLNRILATLPSRENKVIKMRFGIDLLEPLTLEQIGYIYNLTRERIRQIEIKALRRLRHPKRSRKLIKFYEVPVKALSDKELPKNEKFIER